MNIAVSNVYQKMGFAFSVLCGIPDIFPFGG